ncbi:hypothetical protein OSTOST_18527, partial [Ostertagia ostertagi]
LLEHPYRAKVRASPDKEEPTVTLETVDPLKAIQEREQQLQQSGRRLTPIEQQFVDLAKISTAKDAIIDQQRIEMRKTNELLQKGEIESKTNQNRCEELEARLRATFRRRTWHVAKDGQRAGISWR